MRAARIPIPFVLSVAVLGLSGCGSETDSTAGGAANACVQLAADDSRVCGEDAKGVCARNVQEGNSLLIAGYVDDSLTSEEQACLVIDPSLEAAIDDSSDR